MLPQSSIPPPSPTFSTVCSSVVSSASDILTAFAAMDSFCLHNHHRDVQISAGDLLSAESLPVIDTRLLSHSELLLLSQCSRLSSSSSSSVSLAASAGGNDDLTPKIDRSVFNESAGSRKQTFLRLRLARHPPPPRPLLRKRHFEESSLEENSQVVSLLRSLFSIDSFPRRKENGRGEEHFEEYGCEDNEGQRMLPVPINLFNTVYQNLNLDSVQSVLVQVITGNETRRKRGRPRKIKNLSERAIDTERSEGSKELDFSPRIEALPHSIASERRESPFAENPTTDLRSERRSAASGFFTNPNSNVSSTLQLTKKRGRPPKIRDSFNQVTVNNNEPLDLQNWNGALIDPLALANVEDPYQEELKRRTMGLHTKAELLGFLAQLRGEWANAGKKKRVVEASDFGDALPEGWKLMLCIKHKAGKASLGCCRYMSPHGQQFASCKEVSANFCSILQAQSKNGSYATQSDDKTIVPHVFCESSNHCGSTDFPAVGPGMNHPQMSGAAGNQVFEHVKTAEDIADPLKTNLVDMHIAMLDLVNRDSDMVGSLNRTGSALDLAVRDNLKTGDRVNRDGMLIDFFSRDDDVVDLVNRGSNIEDLTAMSNSEALFAENLRKMTQDMATTEELLQFWNS